MDKFVAHQFGSEAMDAAALRVIRVTRDRTGPASKLEPGCRRVQTVRFVKFPGYSSVSEGETINLLAHSASFSK